MTRRSLAGLAAAITALAWGLTVVGAYVRVSASGLGCPDWPSCHGEAVVGGNHALVEEVHRWVATVLTISLIGLALLVLRRFRGERRLEVPVYVALAVLALQVVLGGVTVLLKNVSWTVVAHYGAASALTASIALVTVRLWVGPSERPPGDRYTRLVMWLFGLTYGLLLAGAIVANTDSHESCGTGFPLCNGTLAPGLDHHVVINVVHRTWAGAALVLALYVVHQTHRLRPGVRRLELAAQGVAGLFVVQAVLGVVVLAAGENDAIDVAHSGIASLTWLAVALLTGMTHTVPAGEQVPEPFLPASGRPLVDASVAEPP